MLFYRCLDASISRYMTQPWIWISGKREDKSTLICLECIRCGTECDNRVRVVETGLPDIVGQCDFAFVTNYRPVLHSGAD